MSHPCHPRPLTKEECRVHVQELIVQLSHGAIWAEYLDAPRILQCKAPQPAVIQAPRVRPRRIILTDTEISILDYLCEHDEGYACDIAANLGTNGRYIVTYLQQMVQKGWLKYHRPEPPDNLVYSITNLGREVAIMPQPQEAL